MKNNEFSVKKSKDQTTYTLESASSGSTSAGNVASVSMPMGSVQRRGQIVTSGAEKKVDAPKPRNFVAKNAKTGGAGQHADKKKAEKQGVAKHKKPYMESLRAQIDNLNIKLEGYSVVPSIDRERYTERPGLEGPFHTKSGKVVYYDKQEGKYYDPDSDFYISHDDWQSMNEDDISEEFDAEYDDEAGMAHSNLHTIVRAAKGLIDTIDDKENLPEWAQEKIAKVEGMLTAVWDYLISQEEQGIQEAHGDPRDKGAADAWYHRPYRNPFPKGSPEHAEYIAGFEGEEEGSAGGKQYDRSEHPYKQHTDRNYGEMNETALDEKAPPGMEAEVMRLKKQYPGEPEKAFATAWSIYNKKHGKKEESVDMYFESLEMALERQLEPNMPLSTWEKNFLNANPYTYHQFKNKTPQKKK